MTEFSTAQLQHHAAQIRASGILGRSELMLRLFDFLVDCAVSKRVPKEIEIAMTVFGKSVTFDVGQDAVVRVYIFKLRRRLHEYYQQQGVSSGERLHLPKGEYRLIFECEQAEPPAIAIPVEQSGLVTISTQTPLPEDTSVVPAPDNGLRAWKQLVWVLGAVLVLLLAVLLNQRFSGSADTQSAALRQHPVWADMLDDDLPIYIVVGDYYIFGELNDDGLNVRRLVRDFDINSVRGLEQYLKNHPQQADRYTDLSLKYLPVSVAFALHDVLPLLEPAQRRRKQVQVVLASDITLAMIRSAHVVYIGLLSGMGVLQQLVFEGSRIRIGDNFDEVLDAKTGMRYVSEESISNSSRQAYRDYGYFASRTGTDGNQIIILAGTRDVALQYIAETVSRAASMEALTKQAGTSQNMEGLYSVQALDGSSMGGKLLFTHRFAGPHASMMQPESSGASGGASGQADAHETLVVTR